jgi:hypothetical protein
MANSNNNLKAYVRFDGTGRVIAGSLILQRFKPKVGNWVEIPANECCNYVPTTTTTTTATPTTTTTSTSTSTTTSTSTSTTTSTSTSTTTTTTTAAPSYNYYLGSPCIGGANVIIRSTTLLFNNDEVYHSNGSCCTIFDTAAGPTYDADFISLQTCVECPTTTTTTTSPG